MPCGQNADLAHKSRSPALLTQFATVFVFLCLAVGFVVVSQIVSKLLRPNNYYASKHEPYECGEEIEGSPWVQFNIRFYLIALFFIVFDVEIIFILPWAVVFNEMVEAFGPLAFWDMAIFVGILVLGLAYVWRKGDLGWVKGLTERDKNELAPLSEFSSGNRLGQPGLGAREHV
jgi:NADH-quinone oxidoreductase subunit A